MAHSTPHFHPHAPLQPNPAPPHHPTAQPTPLHSHSTLLHSTLQLHSTPVPLFHSSTPLSLFTPPPLHPTATLPLFHSTPLHPHYTPLPFPPGNSQPTALAHATPVCEHGIVCIGASTRLNGDMAEVLQSTIRFGAVVITTTPLSSRRPGVDGFTHARQRALVLIDDFVFPENSFSWCSMPAKGYVHGLVAPDVGPPKRCKSH